VHTPTYEAHEQRPEQLRELGFEPRLPAEFRESGRIDRATFRVVRVLPAMGTLVSLTALAASGAEAEDGAETAFHEMRRVVALLDRRDSATPLAQLNAHGSLRDAPAELLQVFAAARGYHHLSGGAFDPTVTPVVDLLRRTGGAPSRGEWSDAAALVGAARLRSRGGRVWFERAGMSLTLDGIAKGYVVDRMAAALLARGIERFLINAGGDVRAAGGKQGGLPWTIGVQDPLAPERLLDVLSLRDGAVATSASYEKPCAHIVGEGGAPARGSRTASVLARDAMAADALATAAFVLGPQPSCRLAASLRGCGCLVQGEDGETARSSEWRAAQAAGGVA
jgi:thiamine biosynthesis lipoprotein